jgi:ribosomal protein L12E/L44/L45/RPP1/RPP2
MYGLSEEEISQRFQALLLMLATHAMLFLREGQRGEHAAESLRQARVVIDGLEALQARVSAAATAKEMALLEEILTELRFAFVEAATRGSEKAEDASRPSAEAAQSVPPSGQVSQKEEQIPSEETETGRKRFVKRYQ